MHEPLKDNLKDNNPKGQKPKDSRDQVIKDNLKDNLKDNNPKGQKPKDSRDQVIKDNLKDNYQDFITLQTTLYELLHADNDQIKRLAKGILKEITK